MYGSDIDLEPEGVTFRGDDIDQQCIALIEPSQYTDIHVPIMREEIIHIPATSTQERTDQSLNDDIRVPNLHRELVHTQVRVPDAVPQVHIKYQAAVPTERMPIATTFTNDKVGAITWQH